MEKHVTLVGVLNIVYRAVTILEAGVLVALGFWFEPLMWKLMRFHTIRPHEVPFEVLDLVPLILFVIAAVVVVFSILGIIGAIGVLKRKEWGRILLLVISFFNLARIPLGTLLGVYSIWVLLSDETIRLFNPAVDRSVSSTA
jgi:hypothetical protein